MQKLLEKHSHLLHKLGLGLSFLCAVHCIAMPFLLVALPIVGEQFFTEKVEHVLIFVSLLIGLFVLLKDYKHHKNKMPLALLGLSTVLVAVHLFVHQHSLLTFSSVIMAAAYFLNWRLHRNICATHSH